MSQTRRVPLWAQISIWGSLSALLIFVGMGLRRAREGTVQPGDKIADFGLTLFGGYEYNGKSEIRLYDFRGKVVLVNFWASWCKPCEQEAAALEGAWKHYEPEEQVVFLGSDYVDTEPAARAFRKVRCIVPERPRHRNSSGTDVPHQGRARDLHPGYRRRVEVCQDRSVCQRRRDHGCHRSAAALDNEVP